MPNHCNNIITVSGPSKELRRFFSAVASEKSVFDFNKILPCPKELFEHGSPVRIMTQEEILQMWEKHRQLNKGEHSSLTRPHGLGITKERQSELIARFGYDNWYNWCCKNWGTKWGAYDVQEWTWVTERTITTSYDSAWAPPTNGLVKLSKLFPLLSFRNCFMETGMDFCGYDVIENGEVTEEDEDKISSDTGLKFCEERFGYEPYEDDESVPV